jgi:DNA-binding sugar fermentation-stimulating protein
LEQVVPCSLGSCELGGFRDSLGRKVSDRAWIDMLAESGEKYKGRYLAWVRVRFDFYRKKERDSPLSEVASCTIFSQILVTLPDAIHRGNKIRMLHHIDRIL